MLVTIRGERVILSRRLPKVKSVWGEWCEICVYHDHTLWGSISKLQASFKKDGIMNILNNYNS